MIDRLARRVAALGAVMVVVAACSTASTAAPETVEGPGGELQATTWVLRSYAVDGVLTTVPADLYADADFWAHRVTGFAGCNEYDAVYRTAGRQLLVSMAKTTRVGCGEAETAFESSYLALLGDARFYNVRADTLTIRAAGGAVVLLFDAAPNNPLLGPWVVDSYASAPGALTAPSEGTDLTAVFGLATVGGSAGCNTYDGPYTTNGTIAAIGPLATTRMACPDDVMAQETAFLAALQGVGHLERRAQTILLQDINGATVVILLRPSAAEEAEASPSPSASASASPALTLTPATPSASPSPSPSPSPTPTASPTAAPTATPTAAPTATPAPTLEPPASVPPVATCDLSPAAGGPTVKVAYPADWNTVTTPPAAACRYFDPAPITVPADLATLTTAVMIKSNPGVTYQAALSAATNPTAWNVLRNEPVTVLGLPATLIEATSSAGTPGYPAGSTRYGYLIDVIGAPAWIETVGTLGDATYTANTSVVDLIAAESTIAP
jgi:heat shock protein HslJ